MKPSHLRHRLWLGIKRTQVARARLNWADLPPPAVGHGRSMELDLDLTGEFSLHRLINTAVSINGGLRLVDWLSTTVPDPEHIAHRQALVKELAPLSLFRDRLSLSALLAAQEEGDAAGA